jgi:hypothetical protein
MMEQTSESISNDAKTLKHCNIWIFAFGFAFAFGFRGKYVIIMAKIKIYGIWN